MHRLAESGGEVSALKNNDYHFVTHWRFPAAAEQVYALIANPLGYTRWWSSVYLEAPHRNRPKEPSRLNRLAV